jgi:hypothetical protein
MAGRRFRFAALRFAEQAALRIRSCYIIIPGMSHVEA